MCTEAKRFYVSCVYRLSNQRQLQAIEFAGGGTNAVHNGGRLELYMLTNSNANYMADDNLITNNKKNSRTEEILNQIKAKHVATRYNALINKIINHRDQPIPVEELPDCLQEEKVYFGLITFCTISNSEHYLLLGY